MEECLKEVINAEQFDELGSEQKLRYWYCEKCGQFVLGSWSRRCLCEEG